jgi:Transposase, Mutator family
MVLAEGHRHTMALDQSALLEVLDALKAAEVDDKIRQAAETIYQALIEAELSAVIGAFPHQRTEARSGHRNGYRARTLTTTAGDLELRIPKLRAGSFFPSLLNAQVSSGAMVSPHMVSGAVCAGSNPAGGAGRSGISSPYLSNSTGRSMSLAAATSATLSSVALSSTNNSTGATEKTVEVIDPRLGDVDVGDSREGKAAV